MKTVRGLLLAAAVALGAAACGSGGAGNAGAAAQAQCFVKVTGGGYAAFTVQVLGTSDCTNIMDATNNGFGMSFGMTAAKVNESNAPGAELCSGTVSNYDVMVYGAAGDVGICQWLGLPVVP